MGKFLLLALGIAVAAKIAADRKANPNVRLIAQTVEGDWIQDLEIGVVKFVFAV